MLSYSFDTEIREPLYEYLYRCLKEDILNGTLKTGERLPSRRSFAANLGVSTVTVENAYMQLEAEGYIRAYPRKGFYVEAIGKRIAGKMSEPKIRMPESAEEREVFADLTGNDSGAADFPFSVWSKLMREVLTENRPELLMRAPANGVRALRAAIAGHLRSFRGMDVDPECVIIGAGTDHLYGLIAQLLGMDRNYGVEDPGYKKIANVYNSFGAKCSYIPLDAEGVQIDCLEAEAVDVVHVSPAHHYPTGRVMPIARRHELLSWAAAKNGRYIIEDEYDSEFRLNGRPIPTLQSEDRSGCVIYMNTFTKTLASTIRISYMVLPGHLMELYNEKLSFYSCAVSNFEQYTLARFIERGYFEKHINRMRKSSRVRRNAFLKCIEESALSRSVEIMEEDAGLHFLMKIRTEMPDGEFCSRAESAGIRLDPLSKFFNDPSKGPEHVFLVNYAAMPCERMPETVSKLFGLIE